MATDADKKPSRRDSVVSNINSPEEAVEVARQFQSAVKVFSSDHAYRSLAEVVDRIPRLEANLREQEKTLEQANETCERERVDHARQLERNLRTYTEHYDQFREAESGFKKQIITLENHLGDKDRLIVQLKEREATSKVAEGKSEEECKRLKIKLKDKEDEVAQLKKVNQEGQAKVESLSATLQKHQKNATALSTSLNQSREQSAQLNKALNSTRLQLEEMKSYSVRLENIDIDVL
jgi:chromosome segregation ATPase